jgi:small subunit ribosomal protein S1
LVGWNAVRGFVPASHIVDFNPHSGPLERKRLFSKRVGTTMHLKVIECEPSEQRVVLSERAAQARAGTRDLVLRQLQPGVIVEGVVTNVTEFGLL